MKIYTISELARFFGLSRSTLLYYDRIGLLRAPDRTDAGYRLYTEKEYDRLARICMFRSAGLSLADVRRILTEGTTPGAEILEKRLRELEDRILTLRNQQHLLIAMLRKTPGCPHLPVVDKNMWVDMLEAAGMGEEDMLAWHREFEGRAPRAHEEFLLSLGIPAEEIRQIRELSGPG